MDIALHYFDTLPLHPRPRPLESFTSYLIRIAEANGISHLSGLNAFFGDYSHISRFADYPPRSFGMLPALATHSEAELLETTFYHAGKKFGRVCQPQFLARFFSGLIASSLRFCPLCFQEDLFYRLTWRFLFLQGCPKHACRLLEHCSYCGCSIPLFASPLRLGACPACKRNLRTSVSPRLTEEELQGAFKASQEIEFLLCPHPWETTEPAFREKLGQEFMLLRYNKQLKRMDVCAETALSKGTLQTVELGHSGSKGARLRWYFKYASYLGIPLCQIFINALERKEEDLRIRTMPGKYFLTSEDWVMERVQEAARQLEMSGQRLTIKAICAKTGISKIGLYKYDRVKTFLGHFVDYTLQQQRRTEECEQALLEKVRTGIMDLEDHQQPITYNAISQKIGISSSVWLAYAQVRAFVVSMLLLNSERAHLVLEVGGPGGAKRRYYLKCSALLRC
jgi:TniQ